MFFKCFFHPFFFVNMFLGCEGGRELVPMGLQTFMATSVGRKKTPENECGKASIFEFVAKRSVIFDVMMFHNI